MCPEWFEGFKEVGTVLNCALNCHMILNHR